MSNLHEKRSVLTRALFVLFFVAANFAVPFLGNFASCRSKAGRLRYGLLGAVAAVLFFVPSRGDIVFGYAHVKHASEGLFLLFILMVIISTAIILVGVIRGETLNARFGSMIFVALMIGAYVSSSWVIAPRTASVAANSLSPYINRGDEVVYSANAAPRMDAYAVMMDKDRELSVGMLLGMSGDFVGTKQGTTVLCRKGKVSGSDCIGLDNICGSLMGPTHVTAEDVKFGYEIPEGHVFFATNTRHGMHRLEHTEFNVRTYRWIRAAERVFDQKRAVGFGGGVQQGTCELDRKS